MGRTKKILSDSEIALLSIISWRIRDERQKKFSTSKACAVAMGISPSLLSLWEGGKRFPDETQLELLAKTFGVTVEYLKTPPKKWETIKEDMAQTTSVAQSAPSLDNAPGKVPEQSEPEPIPIASTSSKGVAGQPQQQSVAMRIIGQIFEVDKMHDRGEISPDLYRFSMETINEHLTKLFKSLSKG